VQLKSPRLGRISCALGLLTANLLAATAANAQSASDARQVDATSTPASALNDFDPGPDLGSGRTRVDSAVLFYKEANGRVQATEPVVSVTINGSDSEVLSLKLTADSLTGATPNGATPWRQDQTFTTPAQAPGTTTTVTRASGGSQIVTIPGTGTIARQYTVPANQLPVDSGFMDQRYAVDLGYSAPWGANSRYSVGGSYSTEKDYTSYTATAGLTRDFFHKNTTVSAGLNYEYDESKPYFGTPTPLGVMSAEPKGGNESKSVFGLVAGVSQVMNRYWLAQLNYSIGSSSGYQTDPYRIISVVHPLSGAPLQYLYESRPQSRLRQSIYFGNKIAIGPTFADVSARAYHDDWGVNSYTVEASDRIPLGQRFFIEPGVRWYSQSAADFFHNYLVSGDAIPRFASSDSRLDKFTAVTGSLKLGYKFTPTNEVYLQVEDYKQSGTSHPTDAIGLLSAQDLFSGVNATSVIMGLSFAF
jgi:hypothetical protein